MLHHLARRGVEAMSSSDSGAQAWEQLHYEMPPWAVGVIFGTVLTFILLITSVHYTLGQVVGTLTMVETPTATVVESVKYSDDPDAPLEQKEPMMDVEQTVSLIPNKPITHRIRGTVQHLTALSGFTCRWRGLKQAVVYDITGGLLLGVLRVVFPHAIGARALCRVLAAVALSPVHAALTHRIIAQESPARSKTLMAPLKTMKYLWAPAAFAAFTEESTLSMFHLSGAIMHMDFQDAHTWVKPLLAGTAFACGIASIIFLVIPASIGYTRVEAAFLPEDEDTVVPFDRTFGGKTFRTELGGWERQMAKVAFRSANWEVMRRVLKLYAKMALIIITLVLIAAHVVGLEMWAIMGEAMKVLAMSGKAQLEQRGIM